MATSALVAMLGGGAADAETLGYPNAHAVAYRPTTVHSEWWVDENGDGRKQVPAELISSRGYPYRNDTDFVAWQLETLGVPALKTRDLGAGGNWATNAATRPGTVARATPVRFGVAVRPGNPGHVAFVEEVLGDGRITVVEYDAQSTGEGRMWTGTPASRGFTRFLDFGLSIGRVPGSPIAMARNADGRLEVFGVAANGSTLHRWQLSAGGLWSGWASFGGTGADFTALGAETNADGRIEVFGVGADGTVSHKWQSTAGTVWTSWTKITGSLSSVALARSYDGRLEAFGTNSRQGIYHKAQARANGTWSGWSPFGSGLTDIAAETNADGRIEVFGIASNGGVSHSWQTTPGGDWSARAKLDGRLDRVALTRTFDGRLVAVGTNTSRGVYYKTQLVPGGAWSSWLSIGGGLTDVAAETNADGRVELFAVAPNGVLSHRWQTTPNGGWSAWTTVNGALRP